MADHTTDPILDEALRKRDELDTFIRLYREMRGLSSASTGEAQQQQQQLPPPGIHGDVTDPTAVIYPGLFFGKTQPQAVKLLLERVKRPLKTRAIVDLLASGGMTIGGKKPLVNLWGVLGRSKDKFVLVPKAGWGLAEWYDEKTIEKLRKEPGQEKENGDDNTKEVASGG
jgi:hypothetical protein